MKGAQLNDMRVLKDPLQYATALAEFKELMSADPPSASPEAERLELLGVLLENYELQKFVRDKVDPIDAIAWRMSEFGLRQKDLAAALGSESRASELLNRKRDLSVEQIRVLHRVLRIPAEVLIEQPKKAAPRLALDVKKLPIKEMVRRKWIEDGPADVVLDQVREFIAKVSSAASPIFLRRTFQGDLEDADQYVLFAWVARVLIRSRGERRSDVRFKRAALTVEFLRQVARLSRAEHGPRLAKEFLALNGVSLTIERQLPGMKLDGAVLIDDDGTPVIGMTLRHDRLDSFWFTLLHELAHLQRHIDDKDMAFVDNLEGDSAKRRSKVEREADRLALDAFVPSELWDRSEARLRRDERSIKQLAELVGVHPAVIAGRVRHELQNYRVLGKLVGQGEVTPNFVFEGS
jgi:HTH-type transcriptional regulator/antitoxin HigA